MRKIRFIFYFLTAILGLSLLIAERQRRCAYRDEVTEPLRQALVLSAGKASPLVARAASYVKAHGMTDKETSVCSPYTGTCAQSLADVAGEIGLLDSASFGKPFLEIYPQADRLARGLDIPFPSSHRTMWGAARVAGIVLLALGLIYCIGDPFARFLGYSGLF